ncbi:unnamed protein product [Rhizoctonia solani]|uniref:Uncharacterized protein n=1 Tax=Rhizoctonia solani TaxID=456999 RepID=A0A8H3HIJ0_9AGAM|nr:unnamed protein product [Rhizoctonia solani]CAE6516321.1 unnamed protein product [Rhizoctonia solani]
MGFLTDNEIDLEDEQDAISPPASPRLAATHAQAIAEHVANTDAELTSTVARDYAALCCEEFGLTDLDKDDVLKMSQMNAHLIAIRQYTRVVALSYNINKLLTESFLNSTEFKDHITRRIQATFLDATIPTYVRGSTARLIQHMQENAASWRIPPAVHAHFVNSKAFRKAVAAVASNFRGDMRRKIKKSIFDNLDIGALANKLCVKGYQPTNEHWRRFALLACSLTGVTWGIGRSSHATRLRAQCMKPTKADTQAAIKVRLKANLKKDQERYTGPASGRTKLPARIQMPEWQKDHGKAVNDMSEYVVDVSAEDDVDEDDTGDIHDGAQRQAQSGGQEGGGRAGSIDSNAAPGADFETRQTSPTDIGTQYQAGNARAPRVLVPETQESQSLGGTQHGWASGTLVDRHRRPTHASPSPISRHSTSSTS